MRWLLLAFCVAGCGGSSSNHDAGADLARPYTDMCMGCFPFDLEMITDDLSELDDLAPMPDLATTPDLRKAPVDFASNTDGAIMCPATMGYAGMNVCGEIGMCNGVKYAVDCDGNNCTCSIDGNAINVFAQGNACNNVDNAYTVQCGF